MGTKPPKRGEKIEKKQNTLLVDGNALFKTGFFGAKNVYNKDGQHIGGLYQFLTILRKMLVDDLYHRVYVFWDGNLSGKLRYDFYKPYKSDRGKDFINGTHPIDASELSQRKILWEYINEMYIRQLKHEIIEGDDFIAYYCLTKKENEKITICTNDTDMAQLINEDVKIYYLHLKNYVDNVNYSSYFSHHQSNALLVKSIIGDTADSIKGIKGVGESTLLTNFPELKEKELTIDEIIKQAKVIQENRKQGKKPPLKALTNIIESITDGVQGKDIYAINKKLINLKEPLMTKDGIRQLEDLIEGTLDSSGRELKNVMAMMKRDGIDKEIGDYRYPDYLVPFKQLVTREK